MLDLETAGRDKRDRPRLPPTPVLTIARRAGQIRRRRRAIIITAPVTVVILIAVAVALGHNDGRGQQVRTGAAPSGQPSNGRPQPDPATPDGLLAAARAYAQAWLAGDFAQAQDRWSSTCSRPLPSPARIATVARSIRSALKGTPSYNRTLSSVASRALTRTTAEAEVRFGLLPQAPGTDSWLHYTYEAGRWKTTDCNQLPIGGISLPAAKNTNPPSTDANASHGKTTTTVAEPTCASQTLKPAPDYIGRTTAKANHLATQRRDQIRVTKRDGIQLSNVSDRVSNRVDVVVNNGLITSACHE